MVTFRSSGGDVSTQVSFNGDVVVQPPVNTRSPVSVSNIIAAAARGEGPPMNS
ncbi:MAG: hypothetical protein L3K17_03100 [Thermoplasmata archaeon]|nr:hypothetical protein [Thermoplasmata archaeon]